MVSCIMPRHLTVNPPTSLPTKVCIFPDAPGKITGLSVDKFASLYVLGGRIPVQFGSTYTPFWISGDVSSGFLSQNGMPYSIAEVNGM